ncbi:hypothetical protein HYH03_014712 [Edaphochlamys debaryana]|uniref:Aminoglycoside phosphotransferase domain-containing protein n=1 Tax=Edaphochlamys debaryana TaxID=47281 RepID=A0A836BRQ0_9CHLO|nr:hypothetical protein HYH03_014712 [Edaphochlamys debaryana]|eukprot:KAG2486656.1 hypothetical protein HYH03_014712 [Edaphochlamys debaryana]
MALLSMRSGRVAAGARSAPARMAPAVPRARVVAQSAAAPAPKTGQHTVEDALRDEALSLFFNSSELKTTPTTGGVNNVVQYVETADGERYILRIYNNGNKSEKVEFEHAILAQLAKQELSFQVPTALPSKSGRPHELLSNGAEACVFHIIPGGLAKTTSPEEVGRATGELCTAMSRVTLPGGMTAPIPPYFELFKVHHAIHGDASIFYNEVATNPGFNSCREAIDFLVGEIKKIEERLAVFHQQGLPMQLIHGDLHYDNVMVVGDSVSGLLDFEFCAFDWRAMELAVALSKYVGEDEPLPLCERFITGYAQHGVLNENEIAAIPDLINLRIFSNAVYFTGRAIAGEDSLESLTSRAGSYAKRVRWVNANRDRLAAVIREKMAALVASRA